MLLELLITLPRAMLQIVAPLTIVIYNREKVYSGTGRTRGRLIDNCPVPIIRPKQLNFVSFRACHFPQSFSLIEIAVMLSLQRALCCSSASFSLEREKKLKSFFSD
jgi:hypothetical protein